MNRNPFRKKLILLSIAVLLLSQIGFGQLFTFNGKVIDSATGIGIDHVEIVVRDIYNGTIYRQSASNSEGGFTIEVPASQRVEMGVFHEKYMGKTLRFDEIATLHKQDNPIVILQAEDAGPGHNLIIRAVSFSDVKISSAYLTVSNKATGEVVDSGRIINAGKEWRVQLDHRQPYEITLSADGYFERKLSFVWNKKGLGREEIDWDFFKSKDVLSETSQGDHLWEIQLWPNSLNAQFELRNIEYGPGESYILPETVNVLDKLKLFLEHYSGVVFELQHHSNDWGEPKRDLLLSQRRAHGLLDYLTVRWDLPTEQLAARGMGHAQLDKSCVDAIKCLQKNNSSGATHDHFKTIIKVIAYDLKEPNIQQGGYYDHNINPTKVSLRK
jgi:outer membrane protein OmpA-like peptidoglycan-associated protein